ncbi:Alpha/Beta hydrolase protein [Dactylonectria macrodidyma]|uniref:haloalkane dehalogenase n=1 Tax=Dactylonectria macrodidyma TaxID=307937 RepID=A0A9P9DKK9_9HYPO|nr:Alpha/Beta hydrolase protein [Dactylonectria macrodidyma]
MATDSSEQISADFPFEKRKVWVLGSQMAYVDVGSSSGSAIVFLHGNPTSSYLWRNIIPHVSAKSRCVAPDLIGFGDSDKVKGLAYRVADHQRYLEIFLDAILPTEKLTLVVHDWGSALGFDWARCHEDRIAGLAFMEFVLPADSWDTFQKDVANNFRPFREAQLGRELIINQNVFVETVLPGGVVRPLTEEEMRHYRRPFLEPEAREPVWRFPNEIPVAGEPADVWEKAKKYMAWLPHTEFPKLFFWATPAIIITEDKAENFIREFENMKSVNLGAGLHYFQEDHPHAIGREIAQWLPVSED